MVRALGWFTDRDICERQFRFFICEQYCWVYNELVLVSVDWLAFVHFSQSVDRIVEYLRKKNIQKGHISFWTFVLVSATSSCRGQGH